MVLRTYLSSIRPRQRPPGELVDRVGEEDHGNRRDTGGACIRPRSVSIGGFIDDAYNSKTDRHQDRGDPESRPTLESLAEEEDVDTAHDKLLGAEQASNEEVWKRHQLAELRDGTEHDCSWAVLTLADGVSDEDGEYLGCKVGQGCHAGALLAEKETEGQEKTVTVGRLQELC